MTEERFISQNKYNWDKYQNMLDEWKVYSPNELGQAYLRVCSDLAYAQSHYPKTKVCSSLNALALQFHHILYRRQPQRWGELLYFFRYTIPMSFYRSRRFLLLSLLLFILGEVIGTLSQCLDNGFFESFFGSGYYETTVSNIENGDPMGIYDSWEESEMFFKITINNITVGFNYFLRGLLTPFYTIYMTITTGIMDGCFTTFFFQQGYGTVALVAPNEHGALELPAIIVCSAAGMQLGMGWFFPGKLTRIKALINSAQEALIMVLAMVPFFIVAGFIESFLTRHQEWPMPARVALMAAGLAISIYYIIVLPRQLNKVASPPALPRREGAGTRKTNNKE